MMSFESWTVPDHVPAELVVDYDLLSGETLESCPQMVPAPYRDRRVIYSPKHGGFWVFTHYEEVRQAFQDAEMFGQIGSIPQVPNRPFSIPNSMDPPELQPWRQLLLPLFAPKRIAELEPIYRQLSRERLDIIAPTGRCEFVKDYARALPVWRFCRQLGLAADRSSEFFELATQSIYGTTRVARDEGIEAAGRYRQEIAEKISAVMATVVEDRHRQPGDDIASVLIASEMNGKPLDDETVLNILIFLYNAGTDTTSSAIAMAMLHLATHPEDRKTVSAAAGDIPAPAIEELLRMNTSHHLGRVARHDAVIDGVQIKKGDLLALSTAAASRDPEEFDDPDVAHLDRTPNRHLAFGLGVHRCLGIHQARLEMKVALEEFFRRIPEFELEPGHRVRYMTAIGKSSPKAIPLVFPPA
jgi:cytochrome P450